jgi:pyruvate dehydrogenase E1 component alpha subunit
MPVDKEDVHKDNLLNVRLKKKTKRKMKQAALLDLYRMMRLIRRVEENLSTLFANGEIPGFIHLSVGQEAVSAGVGAALRRTDMVASTHRGHGHALAKGLDLEQFFAELMAKEAGMCRGRGGSMHVANLSLGMLGANAIVGASIPIALGSALAHQTQGRDAVAVAFFGDGAMAEGVLHESLNMAALWRLPLVFICENNGWAEFSPTDQQFVGSLSGLAATFGIPYATADGQDAVAVFDASATAVDAARSGGGPQILEFSVHRFHGHYEGDPQKYRDSDELDGLDAHDPLVAMRRVLAASRVGKERIAAIDEEIETAIEQALAAARGSADPCLEESLADVYATGRIADVH